MSGAHTQQQRRPKQNSQHPLPKTSLNSQYTIQTHPFFLALSLHRKLCYKHWLSSEDNEKQLQGMGGCCCSSRKPQLHGTPIYYYCPPALEEQESFRSHEGATSALTAGFLLDLNLETSTPDAYRPPPVPLPYDIVFGRPQSTDSESVRETISGSSFGTLATCEDFEESDLKTQTGSLLASPRKIELSRLSEPNVSPLEEEDSCPICLEEYDAENPKTITNCQHHFHLSCILEWMERSDTCAICDQEMIFENTFN